MLERVDRLLARRPILALGIVFVLVHVFDFAAGVRFDEGPLRYFEHYLDPALLKTRLAESLLYLHGQPPLFDLFLGVVLKLAGDRARAVFHAVYLTLGFALLWSVFTGMVRLGTGRRTAFVVSALFLISPSFVLYEHWLFYTLPVTAVLALSVVLLDGALATAAAERGPLLVSRDEEPVGSSDVEAAGARSGGESRSAGAPGASSSGPHETSSAGRAAGAAVEPAPGPESAPPSLERPHGGRAFLAWLAFFGCIGVVCATWSAFHLAFYAAVVLMLLAGWWRQRRRILAGAILPFLLVLLLYVKNAVIFGVFSLSSWPGMQLAQGTVQGFPPAERELLIARGELSELSRIRPFSPLEDYPERYRQPAGSGGEAPFPARFSSVPAIAQARKSTGFPNFNHAAYIGIARRYGRDALTLVAKHPGLAVRRLARSFYLYFKSSSEYAHLGKNLERLSVLNGLYDRLLYGRLVLPGGNTGNPRIVYVVLLVGLPLVVVNGLRLAAGGRPDRNRGDVPARVSSPATSDEGPTRRASIVNPSRRTSVPMQLRSTSVPDPRRRTVVCYICFTILYLALVGNLFEIGENNRYRFTTDPLSVVLAGLLVDGGLKRLRRRPTQ